MRFGVRALGADLFQQVRVGGEDHASLDCDRLTIKLLVHQGELTLHIPEADAAKALDDLELLTVRMAAEIEPGAIVEAVAFHDQRVPVPMAHRVAHEARAWICGKRSPIEMDLAVREILKED